MTEPDLSGTAGPETVEVELAAGGLLHGTVNNFQPQQASFFLHAESGVRRVDFVDVKCVAFLARAGARTNPTFPASAQLLTVRLHDGTTVQGIGDAGAGARRGIFLVPTEHPRADRLYLPLSAVRDMLAVRRLGEILVDQRMATREMVEEALRRQARLKDEPLGEILLRKQRISEEQLRQSLALQRERQRGRVGEILIERGFASRAEIDEALEQQRSQRSRRLGDILIELGYASAKMIGIALALQHNVAFASLAETSLDSALATEVPAEFVERWGVVPWALEGDLLTVAVIDPSDLDFKPELQQRSGRTVTEVVVTPQDLQRARHALYGGDAR